MVFWEEKIPYHSFDQKKRNLDILGKKCTLLVILDFHLLLHSNLKIPIFFTHRRARRFF